MTDWCQRKRWRKAVVQFTHVFGIGCCPRACPLPERPEAQLTKILVLCWALRRNSVRARKWRVRSNGCLPQHSSQDEEVMQAANRCAVSAVASFTLSHTKRKRGTGSLPWACFSPLTVFPDLSLTREEQAARKGEQTKRRRRRRYPTCGIETIWMRVMIFIMITQPEPLLSEMQVCALCSQDSGLQFDLTWEHVCLWFVGETQQFHCSLTFKTTAV